MSEMLKRRKRLTEPEARYYLCQLIGSLKYLHQNLVIHRDLKLGNLFIDSSMRIKVGDFGLATRVSHPDEKRRTVCGTPNYIAPEILEGKEGHSFEVDIWSTGVILYTLLIGKPPFESKDVKSTYKRILANSFTFPDHVPICEHAKNLIRSILQVLYCTLNDLSHGLAVTLASIVHKRTYL
jgi:polo-like kinase 1